MNNLRKGKPREFWRQFKRNNFTSNRNVSLSDFYEHFKNLASEINPTVHLEIDEYLEIFNRNPPEEPTFLELDIPITRSEKSIRNLKRNKAFGPDSLLNEYFIEGADLLIERLEILFNKILDSGTLPSKWTKGIIEGLP